MTTRDQRARLAFPEEVDTLFDKQAIERLADIAGIPNNRIDDFGRLMRKAVKRYLSDAKAGLQAGEIHATMLALYRSIEHALEGNADAIETVANMLENLPASALNLLQPLARATGENVPSPDEIRDPANGRERLQTLGTLCASSATIKEGRKRPGGRRSRPTMSVEVISPEIRLGRPANTEEFILCASLGGIYEECKGQSPSRWRRTNKCGPFETLRGPFVALVAHVFEKIKLSASADDVVKAYLAAINENSGSA